MVRDGAVLVTRPRGQGGPLLASLRAAGMRAVHRPLMDLEPLPALPPLLRQMIANLDQYQHVIFISANAVRFGLECIDDFWPQLPVGLHWYAVGGSTAALLRERGLDVRLPRTTMDSEGLLALPELSSVDGQRVLIVKGVGGRELLARALGERGAEVDELACYQRSCPGLAPGELAALLLREQIDTILLSSGEGLQNMLALLSAGETTKFRDIALVVPSSRVATQAREAGFRRVVTADNASDAAMLGALQQWRAGETSQ